MKRSCIVVAIVALLVTSSTVLANEPKSIPDWDNIAQDMELFKGALKQTVGSTVLNTYLPGYGVVFIFTTTNDLTTVQREIERALNSITIRSLPKGERIAVVGCHGIVLKERDIMYISDADTSADPDTWDIYYHPSRVWF